MNTCVNQAFGKFVSFGLVSLAASSALAKSDIVVDRAVRDSYLERAEVWSRPAWISADLQFNDQLDVFRGPPLKDLEKLVDKADVTCVHTEDDIDLGKTGKTPKFTCRFAEVSENNEPRILLDKKEKAKKIKVKYGNDNGEVYGEVIGTRLLWSLGFGADQMYFVDHTHCFGCTADPFKKGEVDPATMKNARTFNNTAIEIKYGGDAITFRKPPSISDEDDDTIHQMPAEEHAPYEGWNFSEILHRVSKTDKTLRHKQLVQRDALRLLAILMQHADNKSENQRLVCVDNKATDGTCDGRVVAMIQDAGSTFGEGVAVLVPGKIAGVDKVNFHRWSTKKIWKNPEACTANLGLSFSLSMIEPTISDEGRVFLAKLLDGFSRGEAGRKRVEDFFRAARVDRRSGDVKGWTDAFLDKVEQIKHPIGPNGTAFECPQKLD